MRSLEPRYRAPSTRTGINPAETGTKTQVRSQNACRQYLQSNSACVPATAIGGFALISKEGPIMTTNLTHGRLRLTRARGESILVGPYLELHVTRVAPSRVLLALYMSSSPANNAIQLSDLFHCMSGDRISLAPGVTCEVERWAEPTRSWLSKHHANFTSDVQSCHRRTNLLHSCVRRCSIERAGPQGEFCNAANVCASASLSASH